MADTSMSDVPTSSSHPPQSHPASAPSTGAAHPAQPHPPHPPQQSHPAPSSSSSIHQDAHTQARWSSWVDALSGGVPGVAEGSVHYAIDHIAQVASSHRSYANYFLTQLKLLDRLQPMLAKALQQRAGEADLFVLERASCCVASLCFGHWEDTTGARTKATVGYPHLLETLIRLMLSPHVDHAPDLGAQIARALWCMCFRVEQVKTQPPDIVRLLTKLVGNVSSKHVKTKQYSLGLLWSLCEGGPSSRGAVNIVEYLVFKQNLVAILCQGLHSANQSASNPQLAEGSETYFLMISLLHTLIVTDQRLQAKNEAVKRSLSCILLPLFNRTTSTTLMDRICETLAAVLYLQSKEQSSFLMASSSGMGHGVDPATASASGANKFAQGGVAALIHALTNPAMGKCMQRLSLALLAAVYRSPTWQMTGISEDTPAHVVAGMRADMLALEEMVEPAFLFLAKHLRELYRSSPSNQLALAVGLTLCCLAQNKPRFKKLLLDTNTLPAILAFLLPPTHYSINDQNKVQNMGLGMLFQLTLSAAGSVIVGPGAANSDPASRAIRSWIISAANNPVAYSFPAPAGGGQQHAQQMVSTTPSEIDPRVRAVATWGGWFQALLDCFVIHERCRPAALRVIVCLVEQDPAVASWLLADVGGFLTALTTTIKSVAAAQVHASTTPSANTPHALAIAAQTRDREYTLLAQLCAALFVLAGGRPDAPDSPEVAANFNKVASLILADQQLRNSLMAVHSFMANQARKREAQMQQQAQAAAQATASHVDSSMHALKANNNAGAMPSMPSHTAGSHLQTQPQQPGQQQQAQYGGYSAGLQSSPPHSAHVHPLSTTAAPKPTGSAPAPNAYQQQQQQMQLNLAYMQQAAAAGQQGAPGGSPQNQLLMSAYHSKRG